MLGMQTQWFLSVLDRMHRSRDKGVELLFFLLRCCAKLTTYPALNTRTHATDRVRVLPTDANHTPDTVFTGRHHMGLCQNFL